MSSLSTSSRRSFLKTSAATAAGVAALGVPAVNVLGANDKLNIGLIGPGGRWPHLMRALARIPEARIAAFCHSYHLDLEPADKPPDRTGPPTKPHNKTL